MPYLSAVAGLMSTRGWGCSSRMVGNCRCSLWKNSNDLPPQVKISGYSSMSSGVDKGPSGGSVWNGVVSKPQYRYRRGASSKRPDGVP